MATIDIFTNAEGNFELDLEAVRIHGSIMETLEEHLFDSDIGIHKDLPEDSRELRLQALRETTYGITDVDDDEGIAKHFLKRGTLETKFDLDGYTECMDMVDSGTAEGAIFAYLENVGTWSKSDFEDVYFGEYPTERAFLEAHYADILDIPVHLEGYIDWDAVAADFAGSYWEGCGYYFESN